MQQTQSTQGANKCYSCVGLFNFLYAIFGFTVIICFTLLYIPFFQNLQVDNQIILVDQYNYSSTSFVVFESITSVIKYSATLLVFMEAAVHPCLRFVTRDLPEVHQGQSLISYALICSSISCSVVFFILRLIFWIPGKFIFALNHY